jgi:hypothetical protein
MLARITKVTKLFTRNVDIRLVVFVIMLVLVVLGAGAPGATGV